MRTVGTRALGDRLTAATSRCGDVEALARKVFETVAVEVPFAFACLATTDPANGLITGAVKSHPLSVGDEELAAAEYGRADLNLFADLALRPLPVGVLSVDTDGRPDSCRRFRELMAPRFGFTDELRLVCRAGGTTWALLGLYRGAAEPPFTRGDARTLGAVHELIADRVRHTLFAGGSSDPHASSGPVVLIIDAGNRVTDMSAAASGLIEELGGWDNGSLPASVLSVATTARVGGSPAKARVPGLAGRWLTVQAVALDGPTTNRSIVLTFETAAQASVGEMMIAARGLTAREQDVAALVLQGASTKVIAGALHLSPHTVQDHLKAIFGKLGVSSRRELIAEFVLT